MDAPRARAHTGRTAGRAQLRAAVGPLLLLGVGAALLLACAGRSAGPDPAPWFEVTPAGPLALGEPEVRAPQLGGSQPTRESILALVSDGAGSAKVLFGGSQHGAPLLAVAVDPTGSVGARAPLGVLPDAARGRFFWLPLGDGTWWLAASGIRPELPTRVFRLGPDGSADELPELAAFGVIAAAAWTDGRFALLCENAVAVGAERARRWSLVCFDDRGTELWRVASDRDDLAKLYTPIALVAAADGRLAVLEHVRERIQWYGEGGEALASWDLHRAIGMAPDYLIGLAPGPGGGLLVSQIAPGHPMPRPDGPQRPAERRFTEPLVWLDREGQLVARIEPRHGNGAPALALAGRAVGLGADQFLAADGEALYRFDRSGVALPVVGTAVSSARLDDPRAAVFDRQGAVFVLDGRSGAVHHFTADGEPAGVFEPLVGDFAAVDLVELEMAPGGGPVLRTSATSPEWIEFRGPGPRVARHADGFPLAVDARGGVWQRAGVGLERRDPSGAREALEVRADGGPARVAIHASADSEGALTVLDMAPVALEGCLCFLPVDPASMPGADDTASYIALWDREQRPQVSFRVPRDLSGKRVERGGGWLLLAGEGRTPELLRIEDGALFALDLTAPKGTPPLDPRLRVGLSADGRTLFALELGQRRLLRYPLPDPGSVPGP